MRLAQGPPRPEADGLVRVYPATSEPTGSAVVWVHGGSFTGGDIDMPEADWVARTWAAAGILVISVDYRVASEGTRYPVPSDDVIAAWRWAVGVAPRYGIDLDRLVLGGASAGANLAAGALLRMSTSNDPAPRRVLLVYPTLLAVQPPPEPSLRAALDSRPDADSFGVDAVRRMYEAFIGGSIEQAPTPAIPGLASAEELTHFPSTLIVEAEVDELRMSSRSFAGVLMAAKRPVMTLTVHGTAHGFLNEPGDPAAAATLRHLAAWLNDSA